MSKYPFWLVIQLGLSEPRRFEAVLLERDVFFKDNSKPIGRCDVYSVKLPAYDGTVHIFAYAGHWKMTPSHPAMGQWRLEDGDGVPLLYRGPSPLNQDKEMPEAPAPDGEAWRIDPVARITKAEACIDLLQQEINTLSARLADNDRQAASFEDRLVLINKTASAANNIASVLSQRSESLTMRVADIELGKKLPGMEDHIARWESELASLAKRAAGVEALWSEGQLEPITDRLNAAESRIDALIEACANAVSLLVDLKDMMSQHKDS